MYRVKSNLHPYFRNGDKMKTLFCTADVHSFYDELQEALVKAGFDMENEDHIFVHCGDLLDRGPDALKCLQFVNNLPENRKILIRGNHEDLLEDVFARGWFGAHDVHNCTTDTVQQLSQIPLRDMLENELTLFAALDRVKNHTEWVNYSKCLKDYVEVGSYVFVHGWIPFMGYDPIEDWKSGDWRDARWQNGMKLWNSGYKLEDRCIVCGHIHSSWGHSRLHNYGVEFDEEYYEDASEDYRAHFEPFIDNGIICLDACTAFSGFVNCYKIEVEDEDLNVN